MPRVFAYSDAISDPWWAPAGLTRGGIPDAIKAYVKYTNAQKGALYEGRVNAIASFPAEGIAVWGQKTLQIRKSALDRINVRRLLIDAKKFVSSVGRTIAFDPNVNVTRQQFVARVTPYFEAIQQRSGLYAFKVVMDESNNTSDTIARNEIKAAIYIQPAYAGEFVLVDFNISPAGVEFNNI
jgi:phage tail sheath protein FI